MVTTYDIAKRAGLNQSTVSRVLSGSSLVNPKTAEKVWQVCKELNYVPNAQARALKTQQAQAIAVYLPQYTETVLADPFVLPFLSGVNREAAAAGYGVILCYQEPDDKELAVLRMVQSHRVDGVIMASPACQDTVLEQLIAQNIPIVTGRVGEVLAPHINSVDVDNWHSGYQATKYLLQKYPIRHLGLIVEEPNSLTGRDFERGCHHAMLSVQKKIVTELVKRVPVTFAAAAQAAKEMMAASSQLDAILVDTALGAFGVLQTVSRSKANIVVLGMESPLLRAMYPELPQIRSPLVELGQNMARVLVDRIQNKNDRSVKRTLYTRIIDEQGNSYFEEPPT